MDANQYDKEVDLTDIKILVNFLLTRLENEIYIKISFVYLKDYAPNIQRKYNEFKNFKIERKNIDDYYRNFRLGIGKYDQSLAFEDDYLSTVYLVVMRGGWFYPFLTSSDELPSVKTDGSGCLIQHGFKALTYQKEDTDGPVCIIPKKGYSVQQAPRRVEKCPQNDKSKIIFFKFFFS